MTTQLLGKLERVEVRTIWPDEARDFMPWLAGEANIKLLGDDLGMELEVQATEKPVGPYSADILCKDTATDAWVLIENQFGKTDHSHLGQLMTYAGGLSAGTIIWIAERFTEEHRAALDWLNQVTNESISFFGLEIEIWRIGDSAPAPKFNIVCKPNDWSKSAVAKPIGELTDAKRLQLEFWTAFREFVDGKKTVIKTTKPLAAHWMNIALGRSGIQLTAIASLWDSEQASYGSHELRAEVLTHGPNSKAFYKQLLEQKAAIETEIGEPLTWYEGSGKQCRVYLRQPAKIDEKTKWPEQHAWLLQTLEKLHKVFGPRARHLVVS
jgi:hypothetical protein